MMQTLIFIPTSGLPNIQIGACDMLHSLQSDQHCIGKKGWEQALFLDCKTLDLKIEMRNVYVNWWYLATHGDFNVVRDRKVFGVCVVQSSSGRKRCGHGTRRGSLSILCVVTESLATRVDRQQVGVSGRSS